MLRIVVLLLAALFAVLPAVLPAAVPQNSRDETSEREVGLGELPAEARQTLVLIIKGGPFPYRQDGVEFSNRERRLPSQARGYYREFTVRTPGARDRGARRIVAGTGGTGDVKTSNEYWYTEDHYNSFRRIVVARGK